MGIVALMAAPRLTQFVNYNKVERSADRVLSDVQLARMHAVRTGNTVRVNFAGDTYVISEDLPSGGSSVVKSVQMEDGDVAVTANASLVFDPRGMLANQSGWAPLTLSSGASSSKLEITTIGRAYRVQ